MVIDEEVVAGECHERVIQMLPVAPGGRATGADVPNLPAVVELGEVVPVT